MWGPGAGGHFHCSNGHHASRNERITKSSEQSVEHSMIRNRREKYLVFESPRRALVHTSTSPREEWWEEWWWWRVCVSTVGSYRRGGGAHCSLDRGEVHHASDDLHHALGRCAATVWVRVRCMSRCGALEQSTQVWVHMHELMQKQMKGVT